MGAEGSRSSGASGSRGGYPSLLQNSPAAGAKAAGHDSPADRTPEQVWQEAAAVASTESPPRSPQRLSPSAAAAARSADSGSPKDRAQVFRGFAEAVEDDMGVNSGILPEIQVRSSPDTPRSTTTSPETPASSPQQHPRVRSEAEPSTVQESRSQRRLQGRQKNRSAPESVLRPRQTLQPARPHSPPQRQQQPQFQPQPQSQQPQQQSQPSETHQPHQQEQKQNQQQTMQETLQTSCPDDTLRDEAAEAESPLPIGQHAFAEWEPALDDDSYDGGSSTASDSSADSELALDPGRVLRSKASGNSYTIVKELGRGAQGTVLLCTHEGEQRAVKVIEQSFYNPADADIGSVTTCMNPSALAKEVETAELGAKLGDKGVPAFFEASEGELVGSGCHALLLIVTEFIDGVTLGAAAGQAMPDECVRVVGKDVLKTLSMMHEKGFIHRDIKPDNILISRKGKAYLCDFSVSQVMNNRRPEDQEWPEAWAEIAGSPLYMAPEVYTRSIDFKVDIWAVGMVLYEMMSGSHPLEEKLGHFPPHTIIRMLMEIRPPSVWDIEGDHSEKLKELVQSMLRRDQTKRATAKELLDEQRNWGLRVRHGDRAELADWCNSQLS